MWVADFSLGTGQKLIKRTIWREHTNLLVDRQTEILKRLADLASAGFARAQDEWEKSVGAWGSSLLLPLPCFVDGADADFASGRPLQRSGTSA